MSRQPVEIAYRSARVSRQLAEIAYRSSLMRLGPSWRRKAWASVQSALRLGAEDEGAESAARRLGAPELQTTASSTAFDDRGERALGEGARRGARCRLGDRLPEDRGAVPSSRAVPAPLPTQQVVVVVVVSVRVREDALGGASRGASRRANASRATSCADGASVASAPGRFLSRRRGRGALVARGAAGALRVP